MNELIDLIGEVTGERPDVEYLPSRALDVPASVLHIRRVREELGWSPRTDFAEGISRTWKWIRTLSHARVREY